MKYLGITLASLGLVSAASVAKKVDYADWKVYRVNVGANADKVSKMMSKMQLEPWKGKPATSDVVDVMVSPSQLTEFEAETQDIETNVMHENLGASIEEENQFSVYAGMLDPILPSKDLLIVCL
jgi:carboxypeptidase A4